MNHTPDMMPPCGSKAAPAKFKGSYEDVKKFLKKFNQMCKACNVPKDQDKCKYILDYCSSKVVKLIEALPSYKDKDWTRLEKIYYAMMPFTKTPQSQNSGCVAQPPHQIAGQKTRF
jgi:hypothetical protein